MRKRSEPPTLVDPSDAAQRLQRKNGPSAKGAVGWDRPVGECPGGEAPDYARVLSPQRFLPPRAKFLGRN